MRVFIKTCAAVAALSLAAASANATTLFLQAGSGHPHLTAGQADWSAEFSGPISGGWEIRDGRSVDVKVPGTGNNADTRSWDTPIPLTSTNVNWTAIGRASILLLNTDFNNRICSFTSAGAFSNCGATVANGVASTVFVPSEGSAYSQSALNSKCIAGGACGVGAILHSVRAND